MDITGAHAYFPGVHVLDDTLHSLRVRPQLGAPLLHLHSPGQGLGELPSQQGGEVVGGRGQDGPVGGELAALDAPAGRPAAEGQRHVAEQALLPLLVLPPRQLRAVRGGAEVLGLFRVPVSCEGAGCAAAAVAAAGGAAAAPGGVLRVGGRRCHCAAGAGGEQCWGEKWTRGGEEATYAATHTWSQNRHGPGSAFLLRRFTSSDLKGNIHDVRFTTHSSAH